MERFLQANPGFGVGARGNLHAVSRRKNRGGGRRNPGRLQAHWKRGAGFVGQNGNGRSSTERIVQRTLERNEECPIDIATSMGTTGGVTMDCDTPQPCGVNVIGGNTLGTAGIAPGATVPLVITAGDAGSFKPKAIYFEALPFSSNDLVDPAALPGGCCVLPLIMVDALVGRLSQLRRGGSADVGLTQGGFANTKELVPVDWARFVSTNEQNLTLLFYNPNVNQTIHAFVDLWGDI